MSTITIEEAQVQLPDLIARAQAGEEIVITQGDRPVATITAHGAKTALQRQPGTLKGTVLYMADDFNAPLEQFKEYTQ